MTGFVERQEGADEYRVTNMRQGFRTVSLFRNGKRIWEGSWKPPRRMKEWCTVCGHPATTIGRDFSGCELHAYVAKERWR